jgi:hypothetical protein
LIHSPPGNGTVRVPARNRVVLLALLGSLIVACVVFARNPNLMTLPWTAVGQRRLAIYSLASLLIALLWWPMRRAGLWFTSNVGWYFTAIALIYGVAAIGPGPFAAAAICCVSGIAVGSFILGDVLAHHNAEIALSFCLGEGLLGFSASLVGRSYLCYPVVFLVMMLLPILIRRQWLALRLGRMWNMLRTDGGATAESIAIALFASVVGIQFLLAMKPEVGTDSLAMHLALPAYVSIHHHWSYDVREFIWAVMPQTTDWCYTLAYSIGGEFAARLLNFANLVALLGLLYSFTRSCCSRLVAVAICTLYASSPLVQVVTGSLFIDNFLAALLFASMTAFFFHIYVKGARLFAAGWLFLGLALSCKAGAAGFLPGIIALAIYASWKRPVIVRVWTAAAAAGLAIGIYFYVLAWALTANPVFPYANEVFHSKLMTNERIADQFRSPLSWHTLTDITFHSSTYIEGSDGCAGFQYFLLLPGALLAMIWRRPAAIVWSAAIGLSAFLISFHQISYLRYIYPQELMLMAPIALFLDDQVQARGFHKLLACGLVAVSCLGNLLFQSASGWYHRDFVWNQVVDRDSQIEYLTAMAPARQIIEVLNRVAPGEAALFCQYHHIAGFAGPLYTTNWHTYHRSEGLSNFLEPIEVLSFANRRQIHYFVSPIPEDLDTWPRALPAFFDDFTEPVFTCGRWVLRRLKAEFTGSHAMDRAQEFAASPPTAGPGTYDDLDIRVVRVGKWQRDNLSSEPLYHTLTASHTAGDELRFAFQGRAIAVQFARDPSFGIAEILIDGRAATTIDEYGASPSFRQRAIFDGLTEGVHILSIRVSGRKNPLAHDTTVSLDALSVVR